MLQWRSFLRSLNLTVRMHVWRLILVKTWALHLVRVGKRAGWGHAPLVNFGILEVTEIVLETIFVKCRRSWIGSSSDPWLRHTCAHAVRASSVTWLRHCSLLHSTIAQLGYHHSTSLYMILIHCTMALLGSTRLYLALLDSTTHYHDSTWLFMTLLHSTMASLASTWLYCILPWLYLALLHSTTPYHGSTWLYLILQGTIPSLYVTLFDSTMALLQSAWLYYTFYHGSTCQCYIDSTTLYKGSTWLHLTLLDSTMALLDSTWLYYILPWLYLVLLDNATLYHGSTWFYLTTLHVESSRAMVESSVVK